MHRKHLFRICALLTIGTLAILLLQTVLQWETVINQKVSLSLPAAVYLSPDENLEFSYADLFHTSTPLLSGGEVEYHIDLLTDRTDIHGYVEVWKYQDSLSVFLEQAKASFSATVNHFQETFLDDTYEKRIWEYDIAQDIHVKQYFSQQADHILVVSLFVPRSLWSEKYNNIFNEITSSITLK